MARARRRGAGRVDRLPRDHRRHRRHPCLHGTQRPLRDPRRDLPPHRSRGSHAFVHPRHRYLGQPCPRTHRTGLDRCATPDHARRRCNHLPRIVPRRRPAKAGSWSPAGPDTRYAVWGSAPRVVSPDFPCSEEARGRVLFVLWRYRVGCSCWLVARLRTTLSGGPAASASWRSAHEVVTGEGLLASAGRRRAGSGRATRSSPSRSVLPGAGPGDSLPGSGPWRPVPGSRPGRPLPGSGSRGPVSGSRPRRRFSREGAAADSHARLPSAAVFVARTTAWHR